MIEPVVVLERDGERMPLERDYWEVMLRLIKIYGIDAERYQVPDRGTRIISKEDAEELVRCLDNALDDIPGKDLWEGKGPPNFRTVNPFVWFSGAGIGYFEDLIRFAPLGAFTVRRSVKNWAC